MRIYKNLAQAHNETLRNLKELGIEVHPGSFQDQITKDDPGMSTYELMGESLCILDASDWKTVCGEYGHPDWVLAELEERVSSHHVNPGEAWKMRSETWFPFLHTDRHGTDHPTFGYSYNERISVSLGEVIRLLTDMPNTRQAMINIWNPDIDPPRTGGAVRVPCSISYQLLFRREKLNVIYYLRSSDFLEHWCNDIALAYLLMSHVAESVGMDPGMVTVFFGSLHAYKKDVDRLGVF